jgi:hypothetical protein
MMNFARAIKTIDDCIKMNLSADVLNKKTSFDMEVLNEKYFNARMRAYEDLNALLSTDNSDGSIAASPSEADINAALSLVLANL